MPIGLIVSSAQQTWRSVLNGLRSIPLPQHLISPSRMLHIFQKYLVENGQSVDSGFHKSKVSCFFGIIFRIISFYRPSYSYLQLANSYSTGQIHFWAVSRNHKNTEFLRVRLRTAYRIHTFFERRNRHHLSEVSKMIFLEILT